MVSIMNKLGLHVIDGAGKQQVIPLAKDMSVVKLLDGAIKLAPLLKNANPDITVIARIWFDVPNQQIDNNPVSKAYDVWRTVKDRIWPYRDSIDYVEGLNEMSGTWDYLVNQYLAFETKYASLVNSDGLRYMAGSWSVGYPDTAFWALPKVQKAYRTILSGGNALGLHEYGPKLMDTDAKWYSLRHRLVVQNLGFTPDIFITETGVDSGGHGKGWKFTVPGDSLQQKAQAYLQSLKWYASELAKDAYIKGATVFTVGPGWDTFDVSNIDIESVFRFTPITYGSCPGVKYIADEVIHSNTQHFSTRSIGDIKYIVIHHTATPPVTPQVVAKYHVRHNHWAGIGYHFFVMPDGTAYEVGNIDTERACVWGRNKESLCICLSGDFTKQQPPDEQIAATVALIKCLREKYPPLRDVKIVGHRDIALPGHTTQCPGNTWLQWKRFFVQQTPEPPKAHSIAQLLWCLLYDVSKDRCPRAKDEAGQ